ncbi:MAG: hypothetical protein ABFS56_19490 [Pseudomonadota bacterium]
MEVFIVPTRDKGMPDWTLSVLLKVKTGQRVLIFIVPTLSVNAIKLRQT